MFRSNKGCLNSGTLCAVEVKIMKVLLIIMLAVLISCSSDIPGTSFCFREFYRRRAAWESLGIDHYRFTIRTETHLPWHYNPPDPQHTITVFPDREPKIDIWDIFLPVIRPLVPHTIDDRFANIYRFARNPPDDHLIAVWYNEKYHFPEIIRTGHAFLVINYNSWREDRITVFEDLRSREE